MSAEILSDHELSIEVFRGAQAICATSETSCVDYHYLRPLLRRIGAVTSLFSHQGFYSQSIAEALSVANESRVAISGTADYSWFLPGSPLLAELGRLSKDSIVSVVDGCSTPVLSSKRLAVAVPGLHLNAFSQDIRDQLGSKDQDIIVTDAFLTQFSNKKDRLKILQSWSSALRLGGLALTTVQIQPPEKSVNKPGSMETFIKNVTGMFNQSEYPKALNVSSAGFSDMVYRYAVATHSRVYDSESELIEEIELSGLQLLDVSPLTYYSKASERTLVYRGLVIQKKS